MEKPSYSTLRVILGYYPDSGESNGKDSATGKLRFVGIYGACGFALSGSARQLLFEACWADPKSQNLKS